MAGSSESLAEMVVNFAAEYDDLTSAGSAIGEIFDRLASDASETACQISESMEDAAEGFSALSEAANAASGDIGDEMLVSYDAIDQLASQAEDAASSVSDSFSSVSFDAFAGALQELTAAVNSAVEEITTQLAQIPEAAQEDADESESAFSGFSLGGLTDGLTMGIFKFQMMTQMAGQLASGLLGPAMNAENLKESFTNLLGSTQAATNMLSQLDAFAAKTQFKTTDIDTMAASLVGFGMQAQNIIPTLTAVGDALSAVGKGTPAQMQMIVDVLGKMQNAGKLTQGDITELGRDGINAMQAIERGGNLSQAALLAMIKNGTLPASDAIKDLTKGIEDNPIYAGGMAKQSETLSGIMSTLSSDWDVFLAKVMTPVLPELEAGFSKLTTILTNPAFQQFATEVGVDIVNGIKMLVTDIGNLVSAGEATYTFFKNNQTAMDALGAALIATGIVIASILIPAFVAWAIAMVPVVAETLLTIGPYILVGAVVAAIVFGIIEAIQHWGAIMSWIKGIASDVGSAVGGFFSGLGSKLHSVIGDIGGAFSGLGSLIHNVWDGVVGDVRGAIDWIIGGIDNFISGIDNIHVNVPGLGNVGVNIPLIPKLATGGFVAPGSVAIAGDAGPELVFGGSSGAHVLSNQASMAALGAGGGKISLTIPLVVNGKQIAVAIIDDLGAALLSQIRSGGHPLGAVA